MTNEAMVPESVSAIRLIVVLGGIAMIAGILVVMTVQLTAARIAENKRHAIEQAVFQVIPGSTSRNDFIVDEKGIVAHTETAEGGTMIYAGYDAKGNLVGIATEAAAVGYQDKIHLLYGYAPVCQCITGIRVLKMAETPGLGDKIAKDPVFLANFKALDAQLNDVGDGLRNAIVTVKHGSKTQAWQIDAISGATISSKAVGRMLNDSAQRLLPRLLPHITSLKEPQDEQ
jgi:electron transport complex protein RnfG